MEMNQTEQVSFEPEINEAQINEWKQRYGEVYQVTIEDENKEHVFYYRKPTRPMFNRFIDESTKKTSKAMERLVNDCVIFPNRVVINNLADKMPGLIPQLSTEILNASGMNTNFTSTKL